MPSTQQEWTKLITRATTDALEGDSRLLDTLIDYLMECEQAKNELRARGYGCIGMGILDTVREVTDLVAERRNKAFLSGWEQGYAHGIGNPDWKMVEVSE